MVTTRTQTQVAFDGVRTAWRVKSGPVAHVNAQAPLSVDGVRWSGSPVAQSASDVHLNQVNDVVPGMITSTLVRWVRSMDGIRVETRLQ